MLMVAIGDEFVWLCVRAEHGAMAADGLYDGDALDDLSDHIGRAGSRLDRVDPGRLDREQVYNELRVRDREETRSRVEARLSVEARDGVEARVDGSDGGWKWKGLELDPAANRIADEALAVRLSAEGRDAEGNYAETGITPAMRQVEAELEHGTLVPDTERFALKSPERFKEKLAKLIARYPDQPVGELAAAIHDGIRYTLLFPGEHYAAGMAEATRQLNDRGYRLELRKPSWTDDSYRGVNCRWSDGSVQFEVQFHTPESWEAKQRTHDIYEKLCDIRTDPRERARLEREQREIVATVPIPPGAPEIESYRRGGRDERG
jgi:hypothetical protein